MKTESLLKILFATVLFCAPLGALAAVTITEVMYDAPGGDSGHEWIEITTDSPIDLKGYKFFEGGVNHTLSGVQGSSNLNAGEIAIISNNSQSFIADFPNYTGTIFKSSFSLSNTGEDISIRDAKLVDIALLSYSSNAGAAGDGNSLHFSAGAWSSGAPNPGSLAATKAIVKPAPAVKTTVKKTPTKTVSKTSTTFSADESASQTAAVGNIEQSASSLPQNNLLWTGLGLAALIVLAVGGVVYAKNTTPVLKTVQVKNEELTAEEFEITA